MAQILVVDDDPDLRGLVEYRLRKAGHDVVAASDGESALAAVGAHGRPDVAVLDVAMPGMSGLELLAALRTRADLRELPAVFLSARILPSDIAAGRALGASYLTKPFVAPALMAAVASALGETVAEPAPASQWEAPFADAEPEIPGAIADPSLLRDADARRAVTSKAPPGF